MTANKRGNFLTLTVEKKNLPQYFNLFSIGAVHVCTKSLTFHKIWFTDNYSIQHRKKQNLLLKLRKYGTSPNLLDLVNDLKPVESRVIFCCFFRQTILCFWNVDNVNAIYDQIKTSNRAEKNNISIVLMGSPETISASSQSTLDYKKLLCTLKS